MAFNPTTGKWDFEEDSISSRLPGLLSASNPLMTQARTGAAKYANKRGLLNSSIGAQAGEEAALKFAVPIASQEAQQTYGKNIQQMSGNTQTNIAGMNITAHDRQYLATNVSEVQKKYGAMFAEILKNNDIPAAARNTYYQHISALRDTDLNVLESIYGVDLDWTSAVIQV